VVGGEAGDGAGVLVSCVYERVSASRHNFEPNMLLLLVHSAIIADQSLGCSPVSALLDFQLASGKRRWVIPWYTVDGGTLLVAVPRSLSSRLSRVGFEKI
jgi:hypothetical protein